MTKLINLTACVLTIFSAIGGCEKTAKQAARDDPAPPMPENVVQPNEIEEITVMPERIEKTEEEWRAQLTPEQYSITRNEGTEPAFTGQYWDHNGVGIYHCVCCGQELFSSQTKYKSGTGWPSFWQPIDNEHVEEKRDLSYGMLRIEVECSRCAAHLGHVFSDGPEPTGQRYCINSASLKFMGTERSDTESNDGSEQSSN